MHAYHSGVPWGENLLVLLRDPTHTPGEVVVCPYASCGRLLGSGPHAVGADKLVHGTQCHRALCWIRQSGKGGNVGQQSWPKRTHTREHTLGGGEGGVQGSKHTRACVVSIVGGLVSRVCPVAAGLGPTLFGTFLRCAGRAGL